MVVLDSQYTDGGRIAAERFVAEEYIIDLLGAFDSHRWAYTLYMHVFATQSGHACEWSGLLECSTQRITAK
jgi:hypothetical protein